MRLAFNRSLVNNYSWLPKGTSSSILNINAKGQWSIIAAICCDGECLIQIFKSTINSELFQQFLCILNYVLKTTNKIWIKNVVLNLDNASIHSSEKTKKLFELMKYNVNYLPPYCPHLAPVELLFKIIKTKVRSYHSDIELDFSRNSGRDCLFQVCSTITANEIKRLWSLFIKQAKICIINT